MMHPFFLLSFSISVFIVGVGEKKSYGQIPSEKKLPIGLTAEERGKAILSNRSESFAPPGKIHSLAEWEEPEAVMTLWDNPDLIRALLGSGPVKLFADDSTAVSWWRNWLEKHSIPSEKISYFLYKTDSIWIRDYGPWFILDGMGKFGIVDTIYNRPRPNDDKIPRALAQTMQVPLYEPNLIHTGGNYYNDGLLQGFSSTLVYTENPRYSKEEIHNRMKKYLGIEQYYTSPLGEKITIEHLDTFGKLVSVDTWVFSEFPVGSVFRKDSEAMVQLLKQIQSSYGTPYKIFRMPMIPMASQTGEEEYRAYINSFISNRTLFYPTYGDEQDKKVKEIYSQALPGYKIVGVSNQGTKWGDSVHCRTRNLLKQNTVFIFPSLKGKIQAGVETTLEIEVFPSQGASIQKPPRVFHLTNQIMQPMQIAEPVSRNSFLFRTLIPGYREGTKIQIYIEVEDSHGVKKRSPAAAPQMTIDYTV